MTFRPYSKQQQTRRAGKPAEEKKQPSFKPLKKKFSTDNYIQRYLNFFGLDSRAQIRCEIPGCSTIGHNEVHHIHCKKMGGDPQNKKGDIVNLMGICRKDHVYYGDKKQYMEFLQLTHLKFMAAHGNPKAGK